MSIAAMTWAFGLPIAPSAKLTLLAIADYADERGWAHPSIGRLAEKTSQSESSVQRRIKELEAAGALTRLARYESNGRRTTDQIRLTLTLRPSEIGAPHHADDEPEAALPATAETASDEQGGGCQIDTGEGVTVDRGRVSLLTPPNEPSVESLPYPQTPFPEQQPNPELEADLKSITSPYPGPVLKPEVVRQIVAALMPEERQQAARMTAGYAAFHRQNPKRALKDLHRLLRDREAWPALIALAPPEPPRMMFAPRGSQAYRAACARAAILRFDGERTEFPPPRGRELAGVTGIDVREGFPRGGEIGLAAFATDDGAVDASGWIVVERGSRQFISWSQRIHAWTGHHAEPVVVMLDGLVTLTKPDGSRFEARRRTIGLRVPCEWPPAYGDGDHHDPPAPGAAAMSEDDLQELARV